MPKYLWMKGEFPMHKIAVVYWSGTGNTRAMATAVLEGVQEAGAEGTLFTPDTFHASLLDSYDAIAFGCPSMGTEVLEEFEFEPMFTACKPGLKNKRIALFGSYGWGDGEWMRNWEKECHDAGAVLAHDAVICQEAPDAAAVAACRALGKALV